MSKVEFDMPHALVTLSTSDGHVEIEVWPKSGQSAYVVLSAEVAHAIAETLLEMADEVGVDPGLVAVVPEASTAELAVEASAVPSNIVDFASRRKPN